MLRVGPAVCLIFALAMPAACGGDDFTSDKPPPPCNEDPWSCPAKQTCWPADTAGTKFACLNQGGGAVGAACDLTPGGATCQAGLFCFSTSDMTAPKVCSPFCDPKDPKRACPGNATCAPIQFTETQAIHVCVPPG